MKVVIDTNVLIAGLINPKGVPSKILNLVLQDKLTILYDNRIIREYRMVLSRKKFDFPKEVIDSFIDFIKHEGDFIVAEPLEIEFTDEDDKMFLEVAKSGGSKYLITGNIKHFLKEKFIVSPKEFLEKIAIDAI